MISFFKSFFRRDRKRYDAQKKALVAGTPEQQRILAADKNTHPEVLYFLARTGDVESRRSVAVNPSTPVQAATMLANDRDADVRVVLAARLVELLPQLSADRHSQLYAYAVQALGMMAQDEVFQVRRALSTAIRDQAKAPPSVVSRLARDVDREVSEPILRFCVALPDEELLDILSHHPEPWVISAIASRPAVSAEVSNAVVETGDVPGTALLVGNKDAALPPETLQKIIERARHYPELHKPIALRPEMSAELARQLAGFVDDTVMNVLEQRSDFDPATRGAIAALVRRRLEYQRQGSSAETPEARLARYIAAKNLTPEVIQDAIAWQERDFLFLALAHLSGVHPRVVKKMIGLGTARPVVALCWKAKLPMRLCVELQRHVALLRPEEILYAKGGTDYPLRADEIKWQLEFFGV